MEEIKAVVVPERVLDQLMQSAGVSTYHPDGSQQQKLYAFARAAIEEAMFRLAQAELQKDATPVAWMYDRRSGGIYVSEHRWPEDQGLCNERPLYTHPKAATVPEDIEKEMREAIAVIRSTANWLREDGSNWKDCVCKYDRAPFRLADAVEKLLSAAPSLPAQSEGEQK